MRRQEAGLLVGLLTFTISYLCLPFAAFHVGKAEAYLDLLQGERQFKRCINWCVEADYVRDYESMIVNRFGAKTIKVSPCSYHIVNEPSGERVRGYNTVQAEDIDRLYGEGAFEEAGEQFFQEYMRSLGMDEP